MTQPNKHAVIIGAGIGGLSAAIRLAVAGWRVTIYEKNPRVGGKMYEIEQDGFRWDTGPSVITMRHVFEELFAIAGRDLRDYIDFAPVDPLTRYFYSDGTVFDAVSDLSQMANNIATINERDVEGYLQYLAYAARIHRITGPIFIYDQPPTLRSFARVPVHEWLRADPLRTMDSAIKSFVRDPKLRQLLGRFATYVGGSPYQAPATLNVIAHVELTGGVWYPRGGIYTIAQGMARLAEELGIEICTNMGVTSINVSEADHNPHVNGVTLENGQTVLADVVLSNLDVTTVYDRLLPQTSAITRRVKTLRNYEPSVSGFVMLLGIRGDYPQLAHHNIFFADDYPAEFRAVFKDQVAPRDPTVYVSITSKTDPEHAPDGHENWFILVNAPPVSDNYDWQAKNQMYRNHVLDRLESFGVSIRDHIVTERILTPPDLAAMSGAWRGALYGPSANSKWTVFRRPHNRCPDVRGLYFAGGTTHPGGGVPMVMLSGKVAADMIQEDYR